MFGASSRSAPAVQNDLNVLQLAERVVPPGWFESAVHNFDEHGTVRWICGLPFSGLSGACQLCMSLMGRRRAAGRQRLFRRRDVRQRLAYAIQRPHPATLRWTGLVSRRIRARSLTTRRQRASALVTSREAANTGRRCFKCAACGHTSSTELTTGNIFGN